MDHKYNYLLFLATVMSILRIISSDTYIVKVGTDQHVNLVDERFLSFTVDPKYLFSTSEKYNNKESDCMASALTPAYIRIAGPSTSHMTFQNSTITFTDLEKEPASKLLAKKPPKLSITHNQWQRFTKWVKATGFDLVFGLNNDEKTESGLWDPNSALSILSVAEKADVGGIFWQLGYECANQTIEEYLNDIETLRVIIETFPPAVAGNWRTVGSDVTKCLQATTRSDFKDYVTLSVDIMDAVLLNGNSSAHELGRMSETDRHKLLKVLSVSSTPLWLTEAPQLTEGNDEFLSELHRAADWMTSLGYSARNGFAVHFRELVEEELYVPTLSFYMALLFKNLVGERVLDVTMEASQAVLFAHCTSLRHKPVTGAVTLFGANMDSEPARFSVKLSRREEGGDIMQFVLAHDHSGNIVVNGRAMYYEGDIRPVVKRVRPYKTLLLNLPPKSFGFWVLANTKIEACLTEDNTTKPELVEAISVTDDDKTTNSIKSKRSILTEKEINNIDNLSDAIFDKYGGLKKRIDNLNNDLKHVHKLLESKSRKLKDGETLNRSKRQAFDHEEIGIRKLWRQSSNNKHRSDINGLLDSELKHKLGLIRKLLGINGRYNTSKPVRLNRERKTTGFSKNKVSKRNSFQHKVKSVETVSKQGTEPSIAKKGSEPPVAKKVTETSVDKKTTGSEERLSRKRRSIINDKHNLSQEHDENLSELNEIDVTDKDHVKLWNILHNIHNELRDLLPEDSQSEYSDTTESSRDGDEIVMRTKLTDDGTTINYSETSKHGLLKSTVDNVMSVLADLNRNLNKFWSTLSILE